MGTTTPYRASWVDRLIDRIDTLPGPAWVALCGRRRRGRPAANVAARVDGYLPVGLLDLCLTSLAIYTIISLAAVHLLDHQAARA